MNTFEKQAVLLDFIQYLGERNLTICMFSKNLGYTTPNCTQSDVVAAYLNVRGSK